MSRIGSTVTEELLVQIAHSYITSNHLNQATALGRELASLGPATIACLYTTPPAGWYFLENLGYPVRDIRVRASSGYIDPIERDGKIRPSEDAIIRNV